MSVCVCVCVRTCVHVVTEKERESEHVHVYVYMHVPVLPVSACTGIYYGAYNRNLIMPVREIHRESEERETGRGRERER